MEEEKAGQPEIEKRGSRWTRSWAALNYFGRSFTSDKLKFRFEDKLTSYAFALAVIAGTVHILYPSIPLLGFICDLFLLCAVVFFIAQRAGIFCSLNEHQVVLCGELVLGFILLSMFIALKAEEWLHLMGQIVVNTAGTH